ncbi:hypothetical protein [Bartonella sp. AP152HLJHH]
MVKSRESCGEDMGRKGANGGWLDCAMCHWNGGMEGVGGKGLLAMNRLV